MIKVRILHTRNEKLNDNHVNMKKILYVGGFELPDKSASAIRVVNNSKLFKEIGYDIYAVGIHKSNIKTTPLKVFNGIHFITIKYPSTINEWLYYLTCFYTFDIIEHVKPNIVVLYDFPGLAILRWKNYCKKRNIKVIGDVTEWYKPVGNLLTKPLRFLDIVIRMQYAHKKLDGIITISKFLFDYYQQLERVLIPPLLDIKAQIKLNENLPERLTLVYAGSGGKNKDRLDYIVDAINMLDHPQLRFKIIGLDKTQYQNMYGASFTDKWNCVEFMGKMSHEETIKEICNSHFQIFVRPVNKVTMAGFPSKLVESFGLGVPVITNKTSNISDYLVSRKNGFLIEGYSASEICSVLNMLLNMSKDEIMSMRKNCLNDKSFDYRTYCNLMNLFLNKIIIK